MGNCPACFTSESVHHSNEEEDDSVKVVRTTDGELFHYTQPVYVKDLMVCFKGYVVLQNLKYPQKQLHPETKLKLSHVYYLMPGTKLSIKETDQLHKLATSVYPLGSSNQKFSSSDLGRCNPASQSLITVDDKNESKLNSVFDSLSETNILISYSASNTDGSTNKSNSMIALSHLEYSDSSQKDLSNSHIDSKLQSDKDLTASTDISASSQGTCASNHIDTSESICLSVPSSDQFVDFNLSDNNLFMSRLVSKSLETSGLNPSKRLGSDVPSNIISEEENLESSPTSNSALESSPTSSSKSPASKDADKVQSSRKDISGLSSDNLKGNSKPSQTTSILRKSSTKSSIKTQKKVRFADEVAFISSKKDTKTTKAQAEKGVRSLKVVISKKQLTELMSPKAADQKHAMEKVIAPLLSPQPFRSESIIKDSISSSSKIETFVAA